MENHCYQGSAQDRDHAWYNVLSFYKLSVPKISVSNYTVVNPGFENESRSKIFGTARSRTPWPWCWLLNQGHWLHLNPGAPALRNTGGDRYHFYVSQNYAWKSKMAAAASTGRPRVKQFECRNKIHKSWYTSCSSKRALEKVAMGP